MIPKSGRRFSEKIMLQQKAGAGWRFEEKLSPSSPVIRQQPTRLIACGRGNAAVEFAMLLPALATLIVGGIYVGLLMYSISGLHTAVEQAARCYSVSATQCNDSSAVQTYAQNQYYGISTPSFIASAASCGHQVSGSVTITFSAVLTEVTVPVSATSCFP
jgi:Flp pilus assembly protein TadG